MTLRFLCLSLAALVGCSGSPVEPSEAGLYDARDVIVDPRDGGLDVDASDVLDVLPTVDVVVFDAPPDLAPLPDVVAPLDAVSPSDASASDGGLPVEDVTATDGFVSELIVSADVPLSPCAELAERYAATVREGQSCTVEGGCEARVCETLCCVCEVFITGSPERLGLLDELRARAEALRCLPMLRCPTVSCAPARHGACSTDRRCVTLRDPPVDGSVPDVLAVDALERDTSPVVDASLVLDAVRDR